MTRCETRPRAAARGGTGGGGSSTCLHGARLAATVALLCAVAGVAAACRDPVAACNAGTDYFPQKPVFNYAHATLSNIAYHNTYADVVVRTDTGAFPCRIVRCGCEALVKSSAPAPPQGAQVFSVPPSAVYIGDTVVRAMILTDFKVVDQIKAVSDANFSYSSQIKSLVQQNKIASIAQVSDITGTALDNELDLAIIDVFSIEDYQNASLKAPFFVSAEALEPSPLSRFEWIKVFALIFADVPAASATFQQTELQYNATRERAFTVLSVPSVVLNVPSTSKGITSWPQPGGATYTTQLLRDANVDYRFENDGSKISKPLNLSDVSKKFSSATHWVNMGLFPSTANLTMQALLDNKSPPLPKANIPSTLSTVKSLAAVKCGNTWAQTKRVTEDGQGNDYFELGAIRPDLVLADLVKIFHPNVQTSDNLTFYYNIGQPASGQAAACPYNQLPQQAPKGRVYVESSYNITGADRFTVEDNIADHVAPACANASRVGVSDVQLYFSRQAKLNAVPPSTILNLTSSMPKGDSSKFDMAAVAAAIQTSLIAAGAGGAGSITVRALTSRVLGKRKLSGGAIAGIVLGSLAFLALLAGLLFCLFARKCFRGVNQDSADPTQAPGKKDAGEQVGNPGDDIEAGPLHA